MGRTTVVETNSVPATRVALEACADAELGPEAGGEQVVGWVDLSSPHLVDLLDELLTGPGGSHLVAIRSNLTSDQLDQMPIQRGLGTLRDAHLGLHTLDPELRRTLARRWPRLRLHP